MISQWALVFCHLPFIDHVWCDVNISSRYVIMGSLGTWPLRMICPYLETSVSVLVSFLPINGNAWCHQYYGLKWAYWYLISISPCAFYAQICSSVMSSVHIWSWLIWFTRLPWWQIFGGYLDIFGHIATLETPWINATWAWHQSCCVWKMYIFFVWR